MIINIKLQIDDPNDFYEATMEPDEPKEGRLSQEDVEEAVRSALWQMTEYGGNVVSVGDAEPDQIEIVWPLTYFKDRHPELTDEQARTVMECFRQQPGPSDCDYATIDFLVSEVLKGNL